MAMATAEVTEAAAVAVVEVVVQVLGRPFGTSTLVGLPYASSTCELSFSLELRAAKSCCRCV